MSSPLNSHEVQDNFTQAVITPSAEDLNAYSSEPEANSTDAEIERLLSGAKLLDESYIVSNGQQRLVKIYDLKKSAKYPFVAHETYAVNGHTIQNLTVVDHCLMIDPNESTQSFETRIAPLGFVIRKEMKTPGHYLLRAQNQLSLALNYGLPWLIS